MYWVHPMEIRNHTLKNLWDPIYLCLLILRNFEQVGRVKRVSTGPEILVFCKVFIGDVNDYTEVFLLKQIKSCMRKIIKVYVWKNKGLGELHFWSISQNISN